MDKLKEKWNNLNLSIRALVPLLFVISFSLMIGGFVTIPLDFSFRNAIKLANPFLSSLEIDYLIDNSKIAEDQSSPAPISDSFLNSFANNIPIEKSLLIDYFNSPLNNVKIISYLFGIPLYTSPTFKPSLDNYILLVSSKEGLGLSEKLSSLKENPNIQFVFVEDKINGEFLLFHANSINITNNLTSSFVIDKIRELEIINEKNYPTLKNLSDYTFKNFEIQSYFARDFILNLKNQTNPISFLDFGFYKTFNRGKEKLDALKKDLITSLTIGLIGLVCFSLVNSYILYIYLQSKKRR